MLRKITHILCLSLLGLMQGLSSHAAPNEVATPLVIEFAVAAKDVRVRAQLGSEHTEFELKGQRKDILSRFRKIYDILENLESKKLVAMRADIEFLSNKIIPPLAPFLMKTKHIVFQIDQDFVRAGLDLLEVDGKPIFLSYPVTYVVSKFEVRESPMPKIKKAFLMADLTCDPELGLQKVAKTIPKSQYLKMEATSLASIKNSVKNASVLVISAHGEVDDQEDAGNVTINKEDLGANFVARLNLDLAYFDSCQMGSAWDFIEGFRKHQSTKFFVAPIISNDAGDSSTKTVTWFFEALQSGKSPMRALAETRQKLYQFYRTQKLDEVTVLNKSFPFRLYEFARKG